MSDINKELSEFAIKEIARLEQHLARLEMAERVKEDKRKRIEEAIQMLVFALIIFSLGYFLGALR